MLEHILYEYYFYILMKLVIKGAYLWGSRTPAVVELHTPNQTLINFLIKPANIQEFLIQKF